MIELLQAVGVPAGLSQSNEELINDPQPQSKGQFIETDHPEVGRRLTLGMRRVFSAIPERRYETSPMVGQHNDRVFHDLLGMSHDEINRLIDEWVIY